MGSRLTAPDLGELLSLRSDVTMETLIRALVGAGTSLQQTLTEWAASLARIMEIANSFFEVGTVSGGLGVYMLAYQVGTGWKPAINTTENAHTLGVCVERNGNNCVIQKMGIVDILTTDTSITIGTTVWTSATAGYVTDDLPTPGTAAFFQEVGYTRGPVKNGRVPVQLSIRIAPET